MFSEEIYLPREGHNGENQQERGAEEIAGAAQNGPPGLVFRDAGGVRRVIVPRDLLAHGVCGGRPAALMGRLYRNKRRAIMVFTKKLYFCPQKSPARRLRAGGGLFLVVSFCRGFPRRTWGR